MMEELRTDICVVGGGAGGVAFASAAALLGAPVVLVDPQAPGGQHLFAGGIPSTVLRAAAQTASAMRGAAAFGLRPAEAAIDVAAFKATFARVRASLGADTSVARLTAMNIRVVPAKGRFVSPDTLEAGAFAIKARRFVVATGSQPAVPRIDGLDLVHYLTADTVFDLPLPPSRLVIIGAGPTGVAAAQAWRALGADVSVIDKAGALGHVDADLAAFVKRQLAADGIDLHEATQVRRIDPRGDGVRVSIVPPTGPEATVDGSHLLLATGREPVVEGLGLETANVRFSASGIAVDRSLRTSNRRIFAVGDVTGHMPTAAGARAQASIVLGTALLGVPRTFDATRVPRTVYSTPPIACIGMDESTARAQGLPIEVWHASFGANDHARAAQTGAGLLKVITDRNGRLLGAGIVGPGADSLLSVWCLALAQKLHLADLAEMILPYPSLSGLAQDIAMQAAARRLTRPFMQRAMRFVRKLG